MNLDTNGINLIKKFEGIKLKAYPDPATGNLPITIGIGSTFYEDKSPIKLGDEITLERAESLFLHNATSYIETVNQLVKSKITQNQFDALVSLCYNIGAGNFQKSSVLRKVNLNPADETIRDSFLLWNKANGKVMKGLTTRRNAEANLYFS